MITARINAITARISDIMSLPIDDFIASLYMVEMERLISEKIGLECLLIQFEERLADRNWILNGSKRLSAFKIVLHLN